MANERGRLRLDLTSGCLEEWAATASQVDKNAVYLALFAVADGSVFRAYETLDAAERPREFVVVVREDLVITVRLCSPEVFGIAYIGSVDGQPGHGFGRAA